MHVKRKATLQWMYAALPSIRISFGDAAAAETLKAAFALLCRDTCSRWLIPQRLIALHHDKRVPLYLRGTVSTASNAIGSSKTTELTCDSLKVWRQPDFEGCKRQAALSLQLPAKAFAACIVKTRT